MSYDGFYAGLSTRASANEILNQALAAEASISSLAGGVTTAAATAETAAAESQVSAVDSAASAALSREYYNLSQELSGDISDVSYRFDQVDEQLSYINGRLAPIQITDVSGMDEAEATVGGGVQAEFSTKIVQPPVGIVTAYTSRVVVTPTVPWNAGWTSGLATGVIAVAGSERINKITTVYAQTDALNKGSSAILGYEHSLGGIGPTSNHDSLSDFFSPNLEYVPNKHRVARFGAFTNQDTGKVIQNYGPYIDRVFREVAPADHPGYVPGRFYTNPYWWVESRPLPANTMSLMLIHIKSRIHIDSLRMFTGSGAGGNYRCAMYTAVQGLIKDKVLVTETLSSPGPNQAIDFSVNTQIDPGMYWIGVACSVSGNTIQSHLVYDKGYKSLALLGHGDPTLSTKEAQTEQSIQYAINLAGMDSDPWATPTLVQSPGAAEPHVFLKIKAIPLPSYPGNGRPIDN